VQALVITGHVASGKTVVAQEIVAIAEERGLAVAAVDLDWLSWVTGASASHDELIARNLAAVAANYAGAGVTRLVAARALVAAPSVHSIANALSGWDLVVVELHASLATLETRLRSRDVGRELEHNLGHLAVPYEPPREARRVVNEERALRDVAIEVWELAGWPNARDRASGRSG
jgi:adenylylsulfate kinase-like enzyme